MRTLRRLRDVTLGVVAGTVVLLVLALVVVPRLMGWVPLTILSGSMEPTIPVGSQVVVAPLAPQDAADLRIGDVVTFMPHPDDPTLVTHRVVERTLDVEGGVQLTTRGDANTAPDAPITDVQVRGKALYHVPYAGYVATLLTGEQKSVGITALAGTLGLYAAWQVALAVRGSRVTHERRASVSVS